jgi:phosphohistidine phosphatase SixA
MAAPSSCRGARLLRNWRTPLAVVAVIAAVAVLAYWFCWPYCQQTTVIVLRHAEKQNPSPLPDNQVPLTAAGHARAATLAQVLAREGVTKIYVTEKLRTQQTAAPLATLLGITPQQIPAANTDELVTELRSFSNRGRVIVVGHSDTVPAIVDKLGGGTVTIGAREFDNLFVLTLRKPSATRIIKATYGEPRTCP